MGVKSEKNIMVEVIFGDSKFEASKGDVADIAAMVEFDSTYDEIAGAISEYISEVLAQREFPSYLLRGTEKLIEAVRAELARIKADGDDQ